MMVMMQVKILDIQFVFGERIGSFIERTPKCIRFKFQNSFQLKPFYLQDVHQVTPGHTNTNNDM